MDQIRDLDAIFVLGPSSSGKTTLCDALSKRLGIKPPLYIKEVARKVMATHGFTRNDVDTYEMQYAIMAAQLEAKRAARKHITPAYMGEAGARSPLLLSDRSAIDPIVYATASLAPGADERRQRLIEDGELQAILPWYRQALFGKYCLVTSPVRLK